MLKLVAIGFLLFTLNSSVAVASEEFVHLDFDARTWLQSEENDQDSYDTQLRARGRVNGSVSINECISFNARLNTGNRFNTESSDTGIGDEPSDLEIHLRHLYIKRKCVDEKLQVEAGSMPLDFENRIGSLGISSNGWLDGVRISLLDDKNATKWILSAGTISDTDTPNVFSRDRSDVNYYELGHERELSRQLKLGITGASYNDVFYSRMVFTYALNQYLNWLEALQIEGMLQRDNFVGSLLRLKLKLGDWQISNIYTHVDADLDEPDKYGILMKDFYGFKDNYYLETSKSIKGDLSFYTRTRIGHSSTRFELGLRVKL